MEPQLFERDILTSLLRILVVLPLVIIAALLFIKYVLANKTFAFQRGYMQVMEQIGIGNKATLIVVKVGEEYFLYSVTESQVQKIEKLLDYVPPQGDVPGSQTFAHILSKLNKRREGSKS